MPEPSYVQAPSPVPVRAIVRGTSRDGFALGWTGQRVFFRWSEGPGMNHTTWVPASDVERIMTDGPAKTAAARVPSGRPR
jgi:hypothetical protein